MQPHSPLSQMLEKSGVRVKWVASHCSVVLGDESMVHTTLTVTGVYVYLYIRCPVIGRYTCVTCGCWSVRIKISMRFFKIERAFRTLEQVPLWTLWPLQLFRKSRLREAAGTLRNLFQGECPWESLLDWGQSVNRETCSKGPKCK